MKNKIYGLPVKKFSLKNLMKCKVFKLNVFINKCVYPHLMYRKQTREDEKRH